MLKKMLSKTALIIFLTIFTPFANPLFNIGDGLKTFLWICDDSQDTSYGWYGYLKIDSIALLNKTTTYKTRFGLPTYNWWLNFFNRSYINSTILIKDTLPDEIDQICPEFYNAQWLEKFERKDSIGSIRFLFPILPENISYHKYDYFSVILNTNTILQFQWIDDTTAIGTFMNNRHNSNGRTVIYAKGAIMVRLTNSNPLRIRNIQIDSMGTDLVSSYLKYDFTKNTKKTRWYGFSIVDNTLFKIEKPSLIRILQ